MLALILAAVVAVVMFAGTQPRIGTWLLIGAVVLVAAGGVLWAHEPSSRHSFALTDNGVIVHVGKGSPEGSAALPAAAAGLHSETLVTSGSGPDHTPAIIVFGAGGGLALLGLVLIRRRADPTVGAGHAS